MKHLLLFLILILFLVPKTINAQTCPSEHKFNFETSNCEKIIVPSNASFNKDKTDWICNIGYKKISTKNVCEKIIVPKHAKLNYSGDDIVCNREYKRVGDSCEHITLPENAVLTAAGNDWRCIATYKREGDKCVKVRLPENAEFFDQGYDFFCKNQFKKDGDKCVKFDIPPNAHLTYLGNDWRCNKGFVKNIEKQSCQSITVPQHAQADSLGTFVCDPGYVKDGGVCKRVEPVENSKFYGTGAQFYCLSGYKKNSELQKCDKIEIPENAKADSSSLDGWTCLGGYIKEGSACKKFDLPEHAKWVGNVWTCEAGYQKRPGSMECHRVSIPENAHAADTFDGWICNPGYTKNYRENRCDKTNLP